MSNTEIRVVIGPANYYSHPGSLARLNDFFTADQLSRAVWIYGERAFAAARPYLPESFALPGAKHLPFTGHCSESDVGELVREAGVDRVVVIGIGGGSTAGYGKSGGASTWPTGSGYSHYRRHLRRLDATLRVVQRCRSGPAV